MASATIPITSGSSGTPPPPSTDQLPVSEAQQAEDTAASGDAPPKTKTKPITAVAKSELHAYFTSKNWALNKDLRKGEYEPELKNIVEKHGLKRQQISRQLRNYKDKKYGLGGITLTLKPEQLVEKLRMSLCMGASEFVLDTLSNIIDKSSSSRDFINFARVGGQFVDGAKLLAWLKDNQSSECFKLLVKLIDQWTDIAAVAFPKTAAGISAAEVKFQRNKSMNKVVFVKMWMEQHSTIGLIDDKLRFGHFGAFLHNILFFNWSYHAAGGERPLIEFPDTCLVSEFAYPVIYYVSGWTLASMSSGKGICSKMEEACVRFVQCKTLKADDARNQNLPTSLVDSRKRRNAKIYVKQQYYDFIRFVESTFLLNLNIDMLKAYADGDVVREIKTQMLNSDVTKSKFNALRNEDEALGEDESLYILTHILGKYANMRGTYFVKHMKGTGRVEIDQLADSQATRTRVITAAACSKAKGEKKKKEEEHENEEKQLWEEAAANVLAAHEEIEV